MPRGTATEEGNPSEADSSLDDDDGLSYPAI